MRLFYDLNFYSRLAPAIDSIYRPCIYPALNNVDTRSFFCDQGTSEAFTQVVVSYALLPRNIHRQYDNEYDACQQSIYSLWS